MASVLSDPRQKMGYMAPIFKQPRQKRGYMASGDNRGQKGYLFASVLVATKAYSTAFFKINFLFYIDSHI